MPAYTHQIGRHELGYQDEDGLLCVRYHGPIVGAEMAEIMEFIATIAAERGPVYVLVDSNDTLWPDVDARRVMSSHGFKDVAALARYQDGLKCPPQFTALLQNAARLLGRSTTNAAVFGTETEARDWLASQRLASSLLR